jgi:DNA-binding NarL/FixJ family response regulator
VPRRPRADGLTSREVEIVRLVTSGRTNKQLAEELGVSTRTVDAHLRSIYAKLGVKSRSAATRYAVEHDLI